MISKHYQDKRFSLIKVPENKYIVKSKSTQYNNNMLSLTTKGHYKLPIIWILFKKIFMEWIWP